MIFQIEICSAGAPTRDPDAAENSRATTNRGYLTCAVPWLRLGRSIHRGMGILPMLTARMAAPRPRQPSALLEVVIDSGVCGNLDLIALGGIEEVG